MSFGFKGLICWTTFSTLYALYLGLLTRTQLAEADILKLQENTAVGYPSVAEIHTSVLERV
jgi:hypothetical protein